jgi:hypothetical protein
VYGATNSSPGAASGEATVTATVGGCRSGRERKLWISAADPEWIVSGVELIVSSLAITELVDRSDLVEPPTRTRARTVTRSPSVNGCDGTKLAPSPCE